MKTQDKIKNLIYGIIADEQKKINAKDLRVIPITKVEYYNKYLPKKTKLSSLTGIVKLISDRSVRGMYMPNQKKMVVFIGTTIFDMKNNNLVDLLKTTFHEYRHYLQHQELLNINGLSFEYVTNYMEKKMREFDKDDYLSHHDEYYTEIDANIYGVNKAEEYLNKVVLNSKQSKYINELKARFEYNANNFDFQVLYNKFYKILMNHKEFINEPWLLVFFNKNGEYKKIKDIVLDPYFCDTDKNLVYLILSSDSYLQSINIDKLEQNELVYLLSALKFTYSLEQKRIKNNIEAIKNGVDIATSSLKGYSEMYKKTYPLLNKIGIVNKTKNNLISHDNVANYYEEIEEKIIEVKGKIR